MEEIRVGTIGSGVIVHSFLDGVARTLGITLSAVYSRSEEKGRALAEEFGAQKVYTDMDAFLSEEEVDVVYIATPNLLHYSQAKAALLAGKHVICEKPFCLRAAEAWDLFGLARERGLFLVEACPATFLPGFEIVKRELPKIGRVKLVLSSYCQYSSRYDQLLAGELPNIFNPEFGGGCLMDINYYNVYLTIALFGRPREASYHPNLLKGKYDTSGIALLAYDGFTAECAGAKDTWGVNSFQIEGEKGYICVHDGANAYTQVEVVTKGSRESFPGKEDENRLYPEVQELVRIFQEKDKEALKERMNVTLLATETIEQMRRKAGLFFPGDKE